ncbi:hypothetical protein BO83DRAFT_402784 [Aspergillus eucalypticola CBS 122712]|uniref:Uncharacterized protein n=1 Tax=Aspergillus eucalypticola (strain CBS 122712 / IBT 29274) TaxID=1448314 RepID=A0A317UVD4_ASPEC|nr:uncharacterized protein BO83DRAFT_402784 [Aspergillus eucalypticola CBS 122712]PWY63970.1 hypothetical protein BO83DRAFT_402784 [Aspergillus eucalypticola CBS 122712]
MLAGVADAVAVAAPTCLGVTVRKYNLGVENFSRRLPMSHQTWPQHNATGQKFAVSNHPSPHRRRNGKSGPRSLVRPGLNYSAGGKGHGLWILVEKGRAQAGWEWRRRILSPVGAGINEVAEPPATIEDVDLLTDRGIEDLSREGNDERDDYGSLAETMLEGLQKVNGILPDGLHNINASSSDGGSCSGSLDSALVATSVAG